MQMALTISKPTISSTPQHHSCDWSCNITQNGPHSEKWHDSKPDYSSLKKNGCSVRKEGAPADWKNKDKIVPWLYPNKKDGINSYHTNKEYHYSRHSGVDTYKYPTYATEGHHCISCDLFKEENYPALVKNAILVGYDINHHKNGFHVPAFIVDIVCHDLQHHASSHVWSNSVSLEYDLDKKIHPLLLQAQEWCLSYCRTDLSGGLTSQKKLVDDLNRISDVIRKRITKWSWFLTKQSKMKLGDLANYSVSSERVGGVKKLPDKQGKVMTKKRDASITASNIMPTGFPDWEYYVNEGIIALENGALTTEPFSRWISRKMLSDKQSNIN